MKTKILFITLLLLIVGCSKPVEDSTLINKDGLMYLPDSDSPYSGEVFTNYDTGEKEYQGTYENGLLIEYSYLNKDGTVKEPVNGETLIDRNGLFYEVNGQKPYTGDVFELYKDGSRKYTGLIKGGKRVKTWTYWTEDGVEYSGIVIIYKRVSVDYTFQIPQYNFVDKIESMNLTDGQYIILSEKGKLLSSFSIKNGKKDKFFTSWYDNGQKWKEGTYKDGKQDGLWTGLYDNGQKEWEETYKDGLWDGLRTFWYDNGRKNFEETWKGGYLDGLLTQWYENGDILLNVTYKEGKEDGLYTKWLEDRKKTYRPQKQMEGTFKDGKKDGLWTEWYKWSGEKKEERTYKDDELISSKCWRYWKEEECVEDDWGEDDWGEVDY